MYTRGYLLLSHQRLCYYPAPVSSTVFTPMMALDLKMEHTRRETRWVLLQELPSLVFCILIFL
jgi:hypothetical protein